ncbi:hypothetical protein FD755_002944 [Muntiacus reevesi]|uniref:Ribosomal protein L10e/L16 domain-containing protein n=1 Tax=Muntiacus reevesi TaxID=9886 RepID=A0A5J5N5P6_MUNRE|nr:hypothetical protein FD755_002944 [Muntiacus reevesi]
MGCCSTPYYGYCKKKPYRKSPFCQDVSDAKIYFFDQGRKKVSMSSFPSKPWGLPLFVEQAHGEKLWQRWFSHPGMAPPHHVICINKMLSCAGADRLQTGMFIMSISTKLKEKEHVIGALCRAKFKFPGRQKSHMSRKWRFTKSNVDEFEKMVA